MLRFMSLMTAYVTRTRGNGVPKFAGVNEMQMPLVDSGARDAPVIFRLGILLD